MSIPDLTPETAAVLKRYLEIQAEMQRLQEEKAALQETLADVLARHGAAQWSPEVDGQKLKIRCTETPVVEYDERVLRQRLGERFSAILAPDIRKIRRCLGDLEPALAPYLARVGAPSPAKVRAALEGGLVTRDEFAGAFTKTVRRQVAVSRWREEPASGGQSGEGAEPHS